RDQPAATRREIERSSSTRTPAPRTTVETTTSPEGPQPDYPDAGGAAAGFSGSRAFRSPVGAGSGIRIVGRADALGPPAGGICVDADAIVSKPSLSGAPLPPAAGTGSVLAAAAEAAADARGPLSPSYPGWDADAPGPLRAAPRSYTGREAAAAGADGAAAGAAAEPPIPSWMLGAEFRRSPA